MKKLALVAGVLLGLLFVYASLAFFIPALAPSQPPPAEGSPMALFMGAMYPTHYLTFVKVLELVGGLLVAIPMTRRLGLLILGPIIVNILATMIFLNKGEGMVNPMIIAIIVLPLFLVYVERRAFAAYLRGG